jgi:hypothetical protein
LVMARQAGPFTPAPRSGEGGPSGRSLRWWKGAGKERTRRDGDAPSPTSAMAICSPFPAGATEENKT